MCAEGIRRRDFLRGAGILGATIAGAGALSACSSGAGATEGEQTSEDLERQVSSEESCDIVVCGSGTAGTVASYCAAVQGAQVICLEKNDSLGGTSRFGEFIGGYGAKVLTDAGVEFDFPTLVKAYETEIDWGAPVDIVRTLFVESGKTIDWLVDEGIPYAAPGAYAGNLQPHIVIIYDDEGNQIFQYEGLLKPLWEKGEQLPNLEYRTECPMIGLVTSDGAVTGVYARNADGDIIKINAKSVILGTGGFTDNEDLFWEAMHQSKSRYFNYGVPGRDGDGYLAMRKLDAAVAGMPTMLAGPGVRGTTTYSDDPNIWFTWTILPHVNEKGERYYDESLNGGPADDEMINNATISQQRAFVIADYTYMAEGEMAAMWAQYSSGAGLEGVEQCEGVYKADTLEELAELMGVPADSFVETVEKYNAACESGVDEEFGTPADFLVPVLKAPFYAAELETAIYCTNGGVKTNTEMQVLTIDGEIIPGLYAIGLDNGSVYKNSYPIACFQAIAQTWAATSGRLAALSACSQL